MDDQIERALARAERRLSAGRGVEGTGFWHAVGRARASPGLAAEYGTRIAALDRRAFERMRRIRVPVVWGAALLIAATAAGAGALVLAGRAEGWLRQAVFLGGFGALLVCTHSLTHHAVGRLMGIRFTHYYLGPPNPPRPGVKLDYATYLSVPPRKRAVMHASGAIVTKVVPFALIPAGRAAGVEVWVIKVLLIAGVFAAATDAIFSVKSSDWKRAIREWRSAR